MYFHGGGYVSGSPPDRYLPLAGAVALAANARVHAVDYRLAPEARFPGAFEDCLAAYRWTVGDGGADPQTVAVLGDSAGGNLAVAVTVAARDENLPLPSCVAVISPFADLTFSGASLELRKVADPYVTRELLESMAAEYLDGADPADPRCSSVFADLHDLPPLLIQVGEDEILFDDATRIRDAASGRRSPHHLSAVGPWHPRLARLHFCRIARIRARYRRAGGLLQAPRPAGRREAGVS